MLCPGKALSPGYWLRAEKRAPATNVQLQQRRVLARGVAFDAVAVERVQHFVGDALHAGAHGVPHGHLVGASTYASTTFPQSHSQRRVTCLCGLKNIAADLRGGGDFAAYAA